MAEIAEETTRPLTGLVHKEGAVVTTNEADELVDENGDPVIPDDGNKFEIQIPGRIFDIHKAVHENLCIAAAAEAPAFNSNGSWSGKKLTQLSPEQYELIRGVFWNDDPRCLIFNDDANNNRNFGLGIEFGAEFLKAKNGLIDGNNLTGRSHFGNLQFIHAMGSSTGEDPRETSRKIKAYMRAMLGVYRGTEANLQPDSLIKQAPGLGEFFNDGNGQGGTTFRSLLMGTTPSYKKPEIRLRALGSALHVIQDSYARGHCRRDGNGNGLIQNFHCYRGQNADEHGHWDSQGADNLDPRDLNTFNGLYGGRAAIEKCRTFLEIATRSDYANLFEPWFEDTFRLHPNATGSDTSI